jgi:tetratricopeptide (TPR) repeat protein
MNVSVGSSQSAVEFAGLPPPPADTSESEAAKRVTANPNDLTATHTLAMALLARGALEEAEVHARNAIRIAPEHPQGHNLLGMVLTGVHRPQPGEYHYRRVLSLMGKRDPIVLANLAWNLKKQGRFEEARHLYQESVNANPRVRQSLLGWARLEEADCRFEAAGSLLDVLDRLFPDDPDSLLTRAVLHTRLRDNDRALAVLDRLERQVRQGKLTPAELAEKGRLLDQIGEYAAAFEVFLESKRRVREDLGQIYQDEAVREIIRRLRGFFTRGRLALLPRADVASGPQPVFILGFPRSGTTLLEQMLSRHSRIAAGDELPFVTDIAATLPRLLESPLSYPEVLSELWMGDRQQGLNDLRDVYLHRAAQLNIFKPSKDLFTDKMPLNETHLGLIALIFPKAPLIHVVRHPLDVMVSIMGNMLTHGFHCASSLVSAATHYVRTMQLVAHYKAEIDLHLHTLRYEDLLTQPEEQLRTLCDFLSVGYEPASLVFHESRHHSRTASYAQVKEPLYDRSRYRYRHYRDELAPAVPILAPWIEKLGYQLD